MTASPDPAVPYQPADSPGNRDSSARILPWIVLGCILAVYVICIAFLHPTNFFGLTEDDSIYFSSAREIAQGHGYILPHIPGTPAATKYPILYPWILSWVWRLSPNFPANLSWAVAIDADSATRMNEVLIRTIIPPPPLRPWPRWQGGLRAC